MMFPERVAPSIDPPSHDDAWIAYVVSVGQVLKQELPDRAGSYWKARVTTIRKRLAGEGWSAEEIEAEVAAFTEAVRAEAHRRREAA